MDRQHTIHEATCSGCGVCAEACPAHILAVAPRGDRKVAAATPERAARCIRCGHCMALCKTRSISVDGLSYEQDFPEAKTGVDAGALGRFLATRRSHRVFKSDPVPRAMLEEIARLVALAPMGHTPHKTQIAIVSKRETIERGLPLMIAMYERLDRMLKSPFMRYFIKREIGPESLRVLVEHLFPMLRYRLPEMKAGKYDTITRGAPALILFHGPRGRGAAEDAAITLTYGLLAAHALGLGAAAIGLVPPIVNKSSELRELFGVPEKSFVHSSMIVGFPKYRFRRPLTRPLAGVQWV